MTNTKTTTEYEKNCGRCGQRILMSSASGKWKALEISDGSTFHTCSNNSNSSNNNNVSTGTPDARPKAFVATNENVQIREQQIEQSPITASATASTIYPYSLKTEMTSKGLVMVTCHVYNADLDKAREDLVKLFTETIADLKVKGIKIVEENSNSNGNGKVSNDNNSRTNARRSGVEKKHDSSKQQES